MNLLPSSELLLRSAFVLLTALAFTVPAGCADDPTPQQRDAGDLVDSGGSGDHDAVDDTNDREDTGDGAVTLELAIADSPLPAGLATTATVTRTLPDGASVDVTAQASWESSDPLVATIDDGQVVGISTGVATLTAEVGGLVASADLEVTAAVLVDFAIRDGDVVNALGSTRHFTAIGTFSDATQADVTSQLVWSSSEPAVATIDGTSGVATVVASSGSARIDAYAEALDATRSVTLTSGAWLFTPAVNPPFQMRSLSRDTATGALAEVSSIDMGQIIVGLALHPSGRHLYGRPLGGEALVHFAVDAATGALALQDATPIVAGGGWSIALDATGAWLFAVGGDRLEAYRVNQETGALTSAGVVGGDDSVGTGQLTIVTHPNLPVLYVSASAGVSAYMFGDDGVVAVGEPVGDVPSRGLAVHPSGAYLFATRDAAARTVAAYTIDQETGALTEAAGSPFPLSADANPVRLSIHPTGDWLYVACGNGASVVMSIDASDGTLDEVQLLEGAFTAAASHAVTPDGSLLYGVDQNEPRIARYAVSGTDGTLSDEELLPQAGTFSYVLLHSP